MSLVLRIGTSTVFDGLTPVDLSAAVQDPSTRLFDVVYAAVGRIPLYTFPQIGARDIWLQAIVPIGVGGGITVAILYPNGQVLTPVRGGARPFNVLLPQGCELLFTSIVAGNVTLWMHGVNDKNFADLPCCHQYNPKAAVQPPPP